MTTLTGNIVDIFNRRIYFGEVVIDGASIVALHESEAVLRPGEPYILPGFTDAHVHIESSMLVPAEFARLAVVHGTVATVSDPHEIANVCGVEGVDFMIRNGNTVPFKFNFGAPSCVPATMYETAGAALDASAVQQLLERDDIRYLSEMMNFPGVLHADEEVMQKIAAAKALGKPVDGHAPGLRGEDAARYIAAGISTDHECFTAEEALEKLGHGMKILIREGSAAKNFDALAPLLHRHAANMMFCSDDKHPDSLADGHINQLCARAISLGVDVFDVLQVACVNPVFHYALPVGLLRVGDPADCIVARDLQHFEILQTYINGALVAENGTSLIRGMVSSLINQFNCQPVIPERFAIPAGSEDEIDVIEALDGQLITNRLTVTGTRDNSHFISDPSRDILKIAVVNRYKIAPIAKGFIKKFGVKQGALASSVAHDSHNIIVVGADDESMCRAVNAVISAQGGISCVAGEEELLLALPVAGLMSNADGYSVAQAYTDIDRMAKEKLGSTLASPFMTLSFMALLVIPHLKISDLGLFDGDRFAFT